METPRFVSVFSTDNDFSHHSVRKQTFIFYPPSEVSRLDLSSAGFYFTGNDDVSRCFSCGLEIKLLRRGENPREIHQRRAPNCSFVRAEWHEDLSSTSPLKQEQEKEEEPIIPSSSARRRQPVKRTIGNFNAILTRTALVTVTMKTCSSLRLCCLYVSDKDALRRENARLRSSITCLQCKTAKVQTVFLTCRHLVTCEACAEKMDTCIKCGRIIQATVRTYLV